MRYKIIYGPDDKRDRWGHTVKAAPIYTQHADTYIKAEEIAVKVSKKHKKWAVCIYDTQGPQEDLEDPQSSLWLIKAFEKGVVYENHEYTKFNHF